MKTQKVTLSSVAKIIMGTSPKGNTYNATGNGLPLLNGPTEFGDDHPDCTMYTTKSSKNCETGDLIFCVRGSTTGRMNWADQKYSLGRGVCSIRGKTQTDTLFIRYCIEHSLNQLLQFANGATFPNLTKDRIFSFKISYPNDRERIVDIIKKYDTLANINRRQIQLLEESARLLFREWFVYFRFPGHEKVKIVDGVPEGWEKVPFPELIDFKEGPGLRNYQFREGGIPFLNIRTFGDDEIDLSKVGYLDENEVYSKYKHFLLKEDDHVISSSGTLGRLVTVRTSHLPLMLNTSLIRMRPKKPMRKWMLKTYLLYGGFIEKTSSLAIGAAQLNFGPAHLNKMTILFPKNSETVNEFEKLISEIYLAKKNLLDQNQKLAQARNLLLPRLMSGEIEV